MSDHRGFTRRMLAVGVIAVAALAGASAARAIDGGRDPIDACVRTANGAVRIVDDPGSCRPGEEPLAWDRAGAPSRLTTRHVSERAMLEYPVSVVSATAACEPGEVVLGGGMEIQLIRTDWSIVTNAPVTLEDGRDSWQVTLYAEGPDEVGSVPFDAVAVCSPGNAAG